MRAKMMARIIVVTLGLGMLVVAGSPVAAGAPAQASRQLTGVLDGNGQLEGGCAWLARPEGNYEVWWPEGYRVEYDPVRLLDPAGRVVAYQGETVTVRGGLVRDAFTICQVGKVFAASTVSH